MRLCGALEFNFGGSEERYAMDAVLDAAGRVITCSDSVLLVCLTVGC